MRRASVLVLGLLLGACAGPGRLVDPRGNHRITAHDAESGAAITLTTAGWDALGGMDGELTIVHAVVANLGETPLLLAPGDLELRDDRGFRRRLLDTGASFHRADDETAAQGRYARDEEAPYDPGRELAFAPLPIEGEVLRLALPWGVLEPGTQMRGFLYFEPIAATEHQLHLVWHIGTPDHVPLVDLRFDFAVASLSP